MNQNSRQTRIRELIARSGECSVEELAEQLSVSGMTVRRDLQTLADEGRVIRTYGGATLGERATFEFTFLERINQNRDAKEAIAGAAVELVRGCRTVMLDGSTTTLAIARRLRGSAGLTVVTTSLPAAAELQHLVKSIASQYQVSVTSTQILPAVAESNFVRIGLKVRVRGSMRGLVESIYDIETDKSFLFLDKLVLRDVSRRRTRVASAAKPFDAEFELAGYAYMPGDE